MQGKKGGVVSLYTNELNKPYLHAATHCSAHKLELAFKDSSKDIKLFQKVISESQRIIINHQFVL